MSCGTRLRPRFDTYGERDELAEKIEDESYSLAHKIRHGQCLDSYELRQAERILDEQGLAKYHDYREDPCECRTEEESG